MSLNDFSAWLVGLLILTGVLWLVDLVVRKDKKSRPPLYAEYARSFFPVILVVLLIRSFVVEPFRIPSGSMIPTLHVGDFILVNKFGYGLRLPVLHTKILSVGEPKRGQVVVFRYPRNPSVDYIKRIVGLPGDHIAYVNKQLTINGKLVPHYDKKPYLYAEQSGRFLEAYRYTEKLGAITHHIILIPGITQKPMHFVVPPHEYFVLGDNRDLSDDSRYWGYVPQRNLVGRAFLVWFSWNTAHGGGVDLKRIGRMIP
ncbi:MAG: signal peptidase I [Acidiferrobacter sp.]